MRVQTHAGIVVTSIPFDLPPAADYVGAEDVGSRLRGFIDRALRTNMLMVETCHPLADGTVPQVVVVPNRDIALVELRHANLTDVSAGETTGLVPGVRLHPQAREQR